ncbi:MAG: hypothetical protein AB7E80_16125 [Hyphomicrobiaceae bacterium]
MAILWCNPDTGLLPLTVKSILVGEIIMTGSQLSANTAVCSLGIELGVVAGGQLEIGLVRFPDGTWEAFYQWGVGIGVGATIEGSFTTSPHGGLVLARTRCRSKRRWAIVGPRGSSFGPSLFGPRARDRASASERMNRPPRQFGGAIDAAANDNAGAFQMRVAQAGGV